MNAYDKESSGMDFGRVPMSKEMRDAMKDVPAGVYGKDVPAALVRCLTKTFNKAGWEGAGDIGKVLTPVIERCKAAGHATLEALHQHVHNELCAITHNNPTFPAVLPIFVMYPNASRPDQIGSGVLIQIGDDKFFLTAAHVSDQEEDGTILIPGRRGLIEPTGYFARMRKPASGRREDDKMDIAYYRLSDECVADMDAECLFLERPDVNLEGEPRLRLQYTFAGYPWRRGRVGKNTVEPDFATFSGMEATTADYIRLGLKRDRHIAVRFNRKKTFSQRQRRVVTSPLPDGVSGGGVFVWSEEALAKSPVRLPLAGVANGFIADENLLIATRLHAYVKCIFYKHPDIAQRCG
ncbi:MAG: hypothetical protein ACXWKG_05170 [Limisphaerales bacterium]